VCDEVDVSEVPWP